MRRTFLLVALMIVTLLVSACGGGATPTSAPQAAQAPAFIFI